MQFVFNGNFTSVTLFFLSYLRHLLAYNIFQKFFDFTTQQIIKILIIYYIQLTTTITFENFD